MNTDNDPLGDRMKLYENLEAGRRLMPLLPVLARIDGRNFHSFTRGMERPFDARFSQVMIDTMILLIQETNACLGYTQSDEITLVWHSTEIKSQLWFDGRIHKMVSQLGAHATLQFYTLLLDAMPGYARQMPTFDARVWQVPNRAEASNAVLWRTRDAYKNSISMAAHAHFSHKELMDKNSSDKQEMLFQKGINWNDYPVHFKRGTFAQRRWAKDKFTAEELESLPPKHHARTNPDLEVERSLLSVIPMPPFDAVQNREAVIFDGEEPTTCKSA